MSPKKSIAYFVSHPIQYQAPLLRKIYQDSSITLKVYFIHQFSINRFHDPGFKKNIQWDTDLLSGYDSSFLKKPRLAHAIFNLIKHKPNFIWLHGYSSPFMITLIIMANILNINVMIRGESTLTCQTPGIIRDLFRRLFFKLMTPLIDRFLYIGSANKQFYQHFNVPDNKLFFCPYTVDNSFFSSSNTSQDIQTLQKTLNIPVDHTIILFASKLQARKRVLDVLRAFSTLNTNDKDPSKASLLVIGDGEDYEAAKLFIKETNQNNIQILGFKNQTEIKNFYALADIFILPSVRETWGLAVNEAMAAGCAIITSNEVGCATDLIKDNGMVFQAGDTIQLTEKLQLLLSHPEQLLKMKKNSINKIKHWSFKESLSGIKEAISNETNGTCRWQNQKY